MSIAQDGELKASYAGQSETKLAHSREFTGRPFWIVNPKRRHRVPSQGGSDPLAGKTAKRDARTKP